jgi:hypothetical protein
MDDLGSRRDRRQARGQRGLTVRASAVDSEQEGTDSDTRAELELLDDRRLSNGVVYLRYRIAT